MAYLNAPQQPTPLPRPLAGAMVSIKASPLAQHSHLWGLGLGSFALGLINGALVISAGVGWIAYRQLLSLSPQQWAALRQQMERALPLPRNLRQQALVMSILLGTSTYTITALWQTTHSVPMALVLLGQTTLTLLIVGLLLRSRGTGPNRGISPQVEKPSQSMPARRASLVSSLNTKNPDPLEQSLGQLSHPDPLKRLVAVRRLGKLVDAMDDDRLYVARAEVSLRSHLLDCFHIMLAHEPEPIVRTAVREGLNLLRQTHQLPEGPPPLPNSHETQALTNIGYRSPVEYIEY